MATSLAPPLPQPNRKRHHQHNIGSQVYRDTNYLQAPGISISHQQVICSKDIGNSSSPPANSLTILPPYTLPHSSFQVHALPTLTPLLLVPSLGKHPILTQQAVPVPYPGHHPSTPFPPKDSHSLVLTQIPLLTLSPRSSGFLHRPPPIELCGKLGKIGGLAESKIDCETERMINPPAGSTIIPSPKVDTKCAGFKIWFSKQRQ